MRTYVLGVDLGTSGIKVGIIDEELDIISSRYWDVKPLKRTSKDTTTYMDQFYADILSHIKTILRLSAVQRTQIGAIAISGQMGGIIGIDRAFNSTTGFDIGIDTRSESFNISLHNRIGKALYTTTCGSPRNTPKIMWWKDQYPSIYKDSVKFIPLNTYISGKLSGIKADQAVIDHTLLSFFGNEDIRNLSWSAEITKEINLDITKFPEIVSPFDTIGYLSASAASACGLPAGIPIIAGAGDQAAGLLGAGMNSVNTSMDISGSTTLIFSSTDTFIPDTTGKNMYIPSVFPGLYYGCNYINGAGIDLTWFKNLVCDQSSAEEFFSSMSEKATVLPPGSDRLLFTPYFGGRQCPYQADLRGSWIGLDWHHGPEHLYRSILESVAYSYEIGLHRQIELFHYEPEHIFCGGGGSKNALWNQIKADVLNLPIQPIDNRDCSLLGAGIIALKGIGLNLDLERIKLTFDKDKPYFTPKTDSNSAYRQYSSLFSKFDSIPVAELFSILSTLA